MPDDTNLTLDDFKEAAKRLEVDAVGDEPIEGPEIPQGENMMHLERKIDRERREEAQGAQPQPEPVPETEPEPEPTPEPEPAGEPKHRVLTDDELRNLVVKAKVNGKEVEYTWEQLRDIKQTQDAAQEFLDRAKREFKEERDAYRKQHEQREQPREDEYLTEEEKRVRALEEELRDLRQHQQSFEESSLTESEERHMRTVFERDGLSEEDAATRLKQIVETYPDAAESASDLFTTNPKNREDLNKRIKTFNMLWQLGKTIEMPEVIQKTAEDAERRGRYQAKVDAKRNLVDAKPGSPEMRGPTREERIKKAAERGTDDAWAELLLDKDSVISRFQE